MVVLTEGGLGLVEFERVGVLVVGGLVKVQALTYGGGVAGVVGVGEWAEGLLGEEGGFELLAQLEVLLA